MLDITEDIGQWLKQQKKFALAVVTGTWKSAPRGVGSGMIIDENGKISGSVSGGCVEGQVARLASEVLLTGEIKKMKFGISNEDAWTAGLSCGGAISVWVFPFSDWVSDKEWLHYLECKRQDKSGAWILSSKKVSFFEYGQAIKNATDFDSGFIKDLFRSEKSQIVSWKGEEIFCLRLPVKPHLLIIGAAHLSRELISLAKMMGFQITVVDPRGMFYDSLREWISEDRLIRGWPEEVFSGLQIDENVYAVSLTHDPKIDDQALIYLLKKPVAYIGALGSRKTHEKRKQRLREMGISEDLLNHIHGPVGLEIGAENPREIALSIMAQIIQIKNSKTVSEEN